MPQVGQPKQLSSPRLPKGPKPNDKESLALLDQVIDDTVIDEVIDPSKILENKKEEGKKEDDKKEFEEIDTNKLIIPPAPSQTIQADKANLFYDWLAKLKPEHWVQVTWYMYQTYPRIIRPDQEKNINVGQYPIDANWILHNHGSGDYMFLVNKAGAPKNSKTLCTAYIKLEHPDYPSKTKMSELDVHYKGNRVYVDRCIAEGKLTADLKPMTPTNNNVPASDLVGLIGKLIDKTDRQQLANVNNKDPKDAAITTAFEIISKGNQAATQMMLEQMKQDSPDKLISLVTLIMGMNKPHDNESGMLPKFLDIMAKKDETIITLMTKMMEAQTKQAAIPVVNASVDPETQFDKSMDRMTKMMEFVEAMGGGGGGKKSTLETVMQYGAPVLANALGLFQNFMAMRANPVNVPINANANNPSNTHPQPQQPMSISQPITLTEEGQEETKDNVTNINSGSNGNGKPDVRDAMLQNQTMQQQQIIQNGLKQITPRILDAINRGVSGDEFASSIDGFLGPVVYNQLASIGKEQILVILKSDPQQWEKLAPVEGLLGKFIDEFISYGEPDEPEELIVKKEDKK